MLKTFLLVGIGGGIGSILRHLTTLGVQRLTVSPFPFGTFAVNVAGSLVAGIVLAYCSRQPELANGWRLFLMTGFCGGYTTFSAFTLENLSLLQSGHTLLAITYIFSSILVSLIAMWLGFALIW